MSRTKAKAELNLKEQIDFLNNKGIIHSVRDKSNLDEAPGAYKDIEEVMVNQRDLVKTIERLTPLGVIKG